MTNEKLNRKISYLVNKSRIRNRAASIIVVLCLLVCATTALLLMRPVITLSYNEYHYENDGIKVIVTLPSDTTVPSEAELVVKQLSEEDENYMEFYEKTRSSIEGEASSIVLYDISFYYDGNYLPVDDVASVNIEYKDNVPEDAENDIAVLHYQNDANPVVLDTVEINVNEENVVTNIGFETEGFSIFAVVRITENPVYGNVDIDTEEIANNSFYIISAQSTENTHYELGYEQSTNTVQNRSYYGLKMEESLNTLWTFELVEGETNKFYLSTTMGENKFYIYAGENSDNEAASVSTVTVESKKTIFTLTRKAVGDKKVFLSFEANGRVYYLNTFGGVGNRTFAGYKNPDGGSELYLQNQQGETVKTLDGKKFAIVNESKGKQLGTSAATVNGYNGLQGTDATITERDGVKYVSGDAVLWQFHAVDADNGSYKISTIVESETKYLRLLENGSNGNGSVTLTANPDDATVVKVQMTSSNDKVFITCETNTYLNCDSGSGIFWSGSGRSGDYSKHYLCEELASSGLMYNLNSPANNWEGIGPSIATVVQEIEGESNLQSVSGGNRIGTFDIKTHNRSDVRSFYESYNNGLAEEGRLNEETYLTPGKQCRFDGWEVESGGATYLFTSNALATSNGDGTFTITEGSLNVTVPTNTVLTGKWTILPGEIVLFFVNTGDTMLQTENAKEISTYNPSYYTEAVAVGHIYNPTLVKVGNVGGKDSILKTNDEIIHSEIVSEYDDNNVSTQIVIDAIRVVDGTSTRFEALRGINQTVLEEKTSLYLQNNPDSNKKIRINNAEIDKSMINPDNYKLYWYLQKFVPGPDAYHIDGALVAKTYEMEIYKVFNGLSESDNPDELINTMEFPLGLIDKDGNEDDYTTLIANTSKDGVYSYDGKQGSNSIYKWTLQSIIGQKYTFKEEGYNFTNTNAKFVSSIVKVNYSDGTSKRVIGTDKTYGSSDLFADKPLTGGKVSSIVFQNYYTAKGKGSFAIKKVSSESGDPLSGAMFELKDSSNNVVQVRTTKEDGSAYFNDLDEGTYTLIESRSPSGYQNNTTSRTIRVSVNGSGEGAQVEVFISELGEPETKLFDTSNKGIIQLYEISNVPKNTTIVINKYFEGINSVDLKQIFDNSKVDGTNPYYIELLKNGTSVEKLYLNDAGEIVGATGYVWTLDNVQEGEYKLIEHNYHHGNYKDTVVSAVVKSGSTPNNVEIVKDNAAMTAELTFMKNDSASSEITIKNSYIDSFTLELSKVVKGGATPISNVEFKVYSPIHSEATSSETYVYTDDSGISHTTYYVGTLTTDSSGIGILNGLKLSDDLKEYQYVIREISAPSDYLMLDKPISISAKIGQGNYYNGIYKLKVENELKSAVEVTISARKIWSDTDTHPQITLKLYAKAGDTVTLKDTQILNNGETSYTWTNLDYQDTFGNRYEYYVREEKVIGYSTSYSDAATIAFESSNLDVGLCSGSEQNRQVTITNTKGFVLPETGGKGIRFFYMLGMLFCAFGVAIMARQRK